MPQEHGFRFEIRGEVFVKQASKSGADVVAAYQAAIDAKTKIIDALTGIPVDFKIGEPAAVSRRVKDGDEPQASAQ